METLKKDIIHKIILSLGIFFISAHLFAQQPNILRNITSRIPSGSTGQGGMQGDSVIARNKNEDSITITIYYLDSTRGYKMDSSINDFTKRFPIPATHIHLGNTGVATKSLLFSPMMKAGWDPGFHAYDVYKWNLEQVRFFNTTRPFTELSYEIASKSEQIIEVFHTQNIKPYWNFSFDYRMINAPGYFRNQKTDHNNYLFTSWYQSPAKRYNNYFIILGNRLQSEENGGLAKSEDLNSSLYAGDRFTIPTKIGGTPQYTNNFFNSSIFTGNRYREFTILLRQQYDFGKKDSLVTDSTVIPLFYPRLRFEHTFKFEQYNYSFRDFQSTDPSRPNFPDSAYYKDNYNIEMNPGDSVFRRDKWNEINNDFSIYQFPDAKNLQQFIKVGADLQLLHGTFDTTYNTANAYSGSYYNLMLHGEYRNRTRNQKWDILAFGHLYLNGYNSGNYHAYISLQRLLGQKLGSLQVGFENVNRSPSFIYDQKSSFYLDENKTFKNETTLHFFGSTFQPKYKIQLGADYYLISNYLYLTKFYMLQQEPTLFNILRVNALKTFRLARHWNWYAEVYLQQKTGSAQLNMPTFVTRNRVMYEGNLGFKNLNMATGVEVRYYTPYNADNYSPILGQFFYQNAVTIRNWPDVAAFLHFRIHGFKAYVRAENLNTISFTHGFHFNNNNFAAPDYPTQGLIMRLGIYWGFVN